MKYFFLTKIVEFLRRGHFDIFSFYLNGAKIFNPKNIFWGAAIAQWIRQRLPSCCPGFKSQALHQHCYKFIFYLCHVKKINKKRSGLVHFLTKVFSKRSRMFRALQNINEHLNLKINKLRIGPLSWSCSETMRVK